MVAYSALTLLVLGAKFISTTSFLFAVPPTTSRPTRVTNSYYQQQAMPFKSIDRASIVKVRRFTSVDIMCQRAAAGDDNGEWVVGDGEKAPAGTVEDIFEAVIAGDTNRVKQYVDAGGDCSVRDSIGDTPLILAVEGGIVPAITMLVHEGGADVNLGSAVTGDTPLHLAAYYGYTYLARVLIEECDAALDVRNKKEETPLSLACFWGNADSVDFLLNAGANPDTVNGSGERPGQKFDSIFVPAEESDADENNTDAEPIGTREAIIEMLEKARAERHAPKSAVPGAESA